MFTGTGVGALAAAPQVCCGQIIRGVDSSTLVPELFDVTAGGAPIVFLYNAFEGVFSPVSGQMFQLQLGDTYDLEIVTNSEHGQTTLSYNGGSQSFVVPANITALTITAAGAASGGSGGMTSATIPVVPGSTIDVEVGGAPSGETGGYNGGGNATIAGGNGGGGASDIRVEGTALANRVIVAGGGGGSGCCGDGSGTGGQGGGSIGGTGVGFGDFSTGGSGTGGTQTGPGTGGAACHTLATAGTNGQANVGGNGGSGPGGGGGGGGGWFGGGGGGGNSEDTEVGCALNAGGAGGGGGSSYAEPSATNVTLQQGMSAGGGVSGSVMIQW